MPAYCTALGKCLLAHLDEEQLEEYLAEEELKPMTPNTITDIEKLRKQLKKIHKEGLAVDDEKFREGNTCIASPVRNYQGRVIAAVSVSIPKIRSRKEFKELGCQLRNSASRISKSLGFLEVS